MGNSTKQNRKTRPGRGWRTVWHAIDEYVLLENRDEALRARIVAVLERGQQFFTRLSTEKSKKHRLLKRFLPSLICLVIGFFLFLPAHQMAQASARAGTTPAGQNSQQIPAGARQPGETDPCATSQGDPLDPLTGLPRPREASATSSGNNACPVTIATTCSITASGGQDWLAGGSGGLLVTTNNTVANLSQDWSYVLAAALALLALPFALAGYQIILGVASTHYAGAVEILSRVILVAFLAILSYTFIQFIIQLENAVAAGLYQAAGNSTSVAVPAANWCVNAQNFFGNLFNLTVYSLQNAARTLSGQQYAEANYKTTLALIGNLPLDILTLLSILLTAQLLIRLALLNFYIILSPLALICGTLPGELGPGAARTWVRGFLAILFVQLLQLLALILGSQLFPASLTTGSDWLNQVLAKLLPIVVLMITLNIPRLFNVSATTLLSTASSSIGGAMTGVILIIRGF